MKKSLFFLLMSSFALLVSLISVAAQTKPNDKQIALIGTKWQLIELRGVVVVAKQGSKEVPNIQLTNDGRFSAYAGCNRMLGGYDLKEGFRIRFKGMASTRMACPDMKTEQIFGEVLKIVDNYSLKGNRMTLNKARMAPLAVFR